MPEYNPIMAFVTSLRHPDTMGDKQQVYRLLERTLRSVCAQTNQCFKVIVVCNELPKIAYAHPAIEYLIVDMEPPVKSVDQLIRNRDAVRIDKGKKYLAALYRLKAINPSHVMFFDADDCIANTITQTVLSGPSERSWVITSGYVYREGSRMLVTMPYGFHKRCGTCFIFSYCLYQLPDDPQEVALEWIKHNLGSHVLVHDYLKEQGVKLHKLPQKGAIYIINTGENHSAITSLRSVIGEGVFAMIKILLCIRLLTPGISRTFGLRRLPIVVG